MSKYKTHFFCIVTGILLGLLVAYCLKRCNRQPVEPVKVEMDTVYRYDTIPHYYPKPVEVTKTKTEYRWLTRVEHFRDTTKMIDSVLVEVPITSKHYSSSEYDAWVSGYEPSLDSIFIRQRTEYITERITQMKPPNKWELDLVGGIDYRFTDKKYTPHVGGEILYKPNRLQVGVRGGIQYSDRVEPTIGAVIKLRIM